MFIKLLISQDTFKYHHTKHVCIIVIQNCIRKVINNGDPGNKAEIIDPNCPEPLQLPPRPPQLPEMSLPWRRRSEPEDLP